MLFNLLQPAGSFFASGISNSPQLCLFFLSDLLWSCFFLSSLHRRCLPLCLLPLPFWGPYMENKATHIKLPALFTALIFGRWRSGFFLPSFSSPHCCVWRSNINPRKWAAGNESIILSHSGVMDIHRLAPVWRLKVQEGGVDQELCLFLLLFPGILDQLGCILSSSSVVPVRPSSTCESSSCECRLVSFSASSSRASCPHCLPPSSIPHPLPHHSHVSLMYFLVAFIALSSSNHRVPRCSFPPDAHFRSSFLPFVHVKLVSGSWRQLGCIPLPSFQWAWDKEMVLTREKKKGSSAYYWSEWNFFWAVDRAPTTSLHDSAVMFKALSLSSLTLLLPWFLTRETVYVALLRAWSRCGVKVLIPASQTTKVAQLCPWNVPPPHQQHRQDSLFHGSIMSPSNLKKKKCSVSACSSSFCDLHIKTETGRWHLKLKRCLDSSEKKQSGRAFVAIFVVFKYLQCPIFCTHATPIRSGCAGKQM